MFLFRWTVPLHWPKLSSRLFVPCMNGSFVFPPISPLLLELLFCGSSRFSHWAVLPVAPGPSTMGVAKCGRGASEWAGATGRESTCGPKSRHHAGGKVWQGRIRMSRGWKRPKCETVALSWRLPAGRPPEAGSVQSVKLSHFSGDCLRGDTRNRNCNPSFFKRKKQYFFVF